MRPIPFLTALACLFFAQSSKAMFEAHEWGTFTSLVGSNGISQNGMYHEDEQLPDFVHGFGVTLGQLTPPHMNPPPPPSFPHRPCHNKMCFPEEFFDNQVVTQKMETPVLYFYTDQLRSVDVNVRFPEGVVTETYPAPVATSPSSGAIRDVGNGNTTFHVDVLPEKTAPIPYAAPTNIYSHARAVDSNVVRSGFELEKFIFYRGIGRFQPRLGIHSENGSLGLDDVGAPSAIFLVHVDENGDGQLMPVHRYYGQAEIPASQIAALELHTAVPRREIVKGEAMRAVLINALVAGGLKTDEATAMIDTWERGYLKVPGLRLLYLLPRDEVESVLPLTITPAPEKVTRVFVGRIEVLLDTEETAILERVLKERDAFSPASLGRFAEPKLRRTLEVYLQRAGNTPSVAVVELLNKLIRVAATADGR